MLQLVIVSLSLVERRQKNGASVEKVKSVLVSLCQAALDLELGVLWVNEIGTRLQVHRDPFCHVSDDLWDRALLKVRWSELKCDVHIVDCLLLAHFLLIKCFF